MKCFVLQASPERKSPRKAFESQSDSVNEAKMQLIGLMRALGIQDDRQAMNVDEIVEEFLDAGTRYLIKICFEIY